MTLLRKRNVPNGVALGRVGVNRFDSRSPSRPKECRCRRIARFIFADSVKDLDRRRLSDCWPNSDLGSGKMFAGRNSHRARDRGADTRSERLVTPVSNFVRGTRTPRRISAGDGVANSFGGGSKAVPNPLSCRHSVGRMTAEQFCGLTRVPEKMPFVLVVHERHSQKKKYNPEP
jgi:hypothetical protein